MSRISHQVPKLIFSRGGGGGRLFEGGHLVQILSLRRGANSKWSAYLKLGANLSIYSKWGFKCHKFFPQILCLQVSVLIIHWHCFQVS